MKKFVSLFLVLMLSLPAIASIQMSCDEASLCPDVSKVNGPVSSFFSKVSGMNSLISSILESQIKKQMNEALGADFKVKVVPFGAKSLLQGLFKEFSAYSDYANIDGFYISNVNAKTLCGYNHFVYKDGKVYTKENFLMSFSADITSDDLQKLFDSDEYKKIINSMNIRIGGVNVLNVFNPRAIIVGNRLEFSVEVISPLTLGKAKKITSLMSMVVSNGKILFTNLQIKPNLANTRLEALLPLINNLNPFVIKASILNNRESSVKIKNIDFVGDKIVIKGLVIVPKNYYND